MSYTVGQADVGRNLCQRIEWAPAAYNNGGATSTPWRCANVPFTYRLTPTVSINPGDVIEPSAGYLVTPLINNAGPTKSRPAEWQLSKMILDPGQAEPAGGTGNVAPCTFFAGTNCQQVGGGTNREFGVGATNVGAYNGADDVPAGSKVCFALSVNTYAHNSSGWLYSSLACVTIGKKPKVQVWGGDLAVGRRFQGAAVPTSASRVDTSVSNYTTDPNGRFGSWIEYATLAPGAIVGAGSASAYSGGIRDGDPQRVDQLSFANTAACGTGPGCFTSMSNMGVIPDVAGRYASTAATPLASGDHAIDALSGVYQVNGNVKLTGGTLGAGKTVVIRATGTVTISGDLRYDAAPVASAQQLPQLLILANKIVIRENVGQVDAWLVAHGATGVVETCSLRDQGADSFVLAGGDRPTIDICNQALTVNGPLMARELWLRRTAGADTTSRDEPAERFNLRGDAFLWAYAQSEGRSVVRTVQVREAAPRF